MPLSSGLPILFIRGEKVLLDEDLVVLYGVETRAVVQAVKRNVERFPDDFMFQLTREEWANLRSQSAISSSEGFGGRRFALRDDNYPCALDGVTSG